MSVKNIECQLAEAQIGRYLSSGVMSPEALEQLEGHIAECAECTGFLSEKRAGLQAMLAGRSSAEAEPRPRAASSPWTRATQPTHAAIHVEDEESSEAPKANWLQRLRRPAIANLETGVESLEPAPASKTLLKPLALSGALALVLVAMSFVSRNPNALLGEKVMPATQPAPSSVPAKSTPTPVAATAPLVAATPDATSTPPEATSPPADSGSTAPTSPTPEPKAEVVVAKPIAKRATTRRPTSTSRPSVAPSPAPANPRGTIRVYDSQGNPVTPNKNR